MFRLPESRRWLRLPIRRREAVTDEVDQELEFHLAMRTREIESLGATPAEARARALHRFGDLDEARRALVRAGRRRATAGLVATWLSDFGRDLRFAAREILRHRSFTAVAVAVLGLGIGLTSSVASIVDRLALHPLPYPNPERLGVVTMIWKQGDHTLQVPPNRAIRDAIVGAPGVIRVDAHQSRPATVDFEGTPDPVPIRVVSPGLVPGLGGRVALGRLFTDEDARPSAPLTAVLAHSTWRRRFGARPDVLGRSLRIDGRVATIIGVMAPGFDLTSLDGRPRAEIWLPFQQSATPPGQGRANTATPVDDNAAVLLTLVPGLRPRDLSPAIDGRVKAAVGGGDEFARSFQVVVRGSEELVGGELRQTLALLLGAVGLVLLVACANVAALLLGQALTRFTEFGVRQALGAARSRLARQLLAEASLLGALGLGASIAVSGALLAAVRAFRPASLLTLDEVHVGGFTLITAGGVAVIAIVAFGLAPIWAVSRAQAAAALIGRVRSEHHRGAGRLRSALVVGQIAVTLVLLVGAGLLLESFLRQRNLPMGFEPANLGVVSLGLPAREFPDPVSRAVWIDQLTERVRHLPGVVAATAAGNSPIDFGVTRGELLPEGRPLPPTETASLMPYREVSADYFSVVGQPLLVGRPITADSNGSEIIIDAPTARRVWGSLDVIGRRVRMDRSSAQWRTIVGVAAELRGLGGGFEDAPVVYRQTRRGGAFATLLVRFAGPGGLEAVKRTVRQLHPDLRIRSAEMVPAAIAEQLAGDRFTTLIVIAFAALALGLALVGLYGVIAYAVRQRHFEFGVRMALGAVPARVRSLVLREGMARIGLGLCLGFLGSVGIARLVGGMLYRMSPWDPWVFGGAAVGLALVGLAAMWLPARRASRTDPLTVMRAE